jgi:hypothetical protein
MKILFVKLTGSGKASDGRGLGQSLCVFSCCCGRLGETDVRVRPSVFMISPPERMRASKDRKSRKSVLLLPSYHTRKKTDSGFKNSVNSNKCSYHAPYIPEPPEITARTLLSNNLEKHTRGRRWRRRTRTTLKSRRKRIFEPRRSKGL